jgi:superfamily II DNA helicase RecQ
LSAIIYRRALDEHERGILHMRSDGSPQKQARDRRVDNISRLSLRESLKKHFRYAAFRSLQEEIVRSALAGNGVFVLVPTGERSHGDIFEFRARSPSQKCR